jgi:hypothetical protein
MWTLIVTTLVFAGGEAGGCRRTVFLNFPDEAKCRKAAAAADSAGPTDPNQGNPPDRGAVCGALRSGIEARTPR